MAAEGSCCSKQFCGRDTDMIGRHGMGTLQGTRQHGCFGEGVCAAQQTARTLMDGEHRFLVRSTGEIRNLSRDVYQRIDIDWNMTVPGEKMTNLEWALKGNAPRGLDGYPIELHHFTQEEPGVVIEMLYSKHDQYSKQLHIFIGKGQSFRNDPVLKKSYQSFYSKYWIQRAQEVVKLKTRGKLQ